MNHISRDQDIKESQEEETLVRVHVENHFHESSESLRKEVPEVRDVRQGEDLELGTDSGSADTSVTLHDPQQNARLVVSTANCPSFDPEDLQDTSTPLLEYLQNVSLAVSLADLARYRYRECYNRANTIGHEQLMAQVIGEDLSVEMSEPNNDRHLMDSANVHVVRQISAAVNSENLTSDSDVLRQISSDSE